MGGKRANREECFILFCLECIKKFVYSSSVRKCIRNITLSVFVAIADQRPWAAELYLLSAIKDSAERTSVGNKSNTGWGWCEDVADGSCCLVTLIGCWSKSVGRWPAACWTMSSSSSRTELLIRPLLWWKDLGNASLAGRRLLLLANWWL